MLRKIVTAAFVAGLAALLMPTKVDAYGAAHVGYTHVGPNGVYHTGETVTSGPGGVHAYGGTTAAGYGGAYHAGYGEGVGYGGAASGGYHYTAGYAGGAAVGGASYSYVR
jgi:hypothetical protein